MKKRMFALMLMWFVYHTDNPANVIKLLNLLSAKDATEAKVVYERPGGMYDFFVFYQADNEIKL
jgi:hypothetical protein